MVKSVSSNVEARGDGLLKSLSGFRSQTGSPEQSRPFRGSEQRRAAAAKRNQARRRLGSRSTTGRSRLFDLELALTFSA